MKNSCHMCWSSACSSTTCAPVSRAASAISISRCVVSTVPMSDETASAKVTVVAGSWINNERLVLLESQAPRSEHSR